MVTATLQNPIIRIRGDNYSSNAKWLEPDGIKHAQGMYVAANAFLFAHLSKVRDN